MPGSIEINKFRSIKKLKFSIPDRGVWLLAGGNGAGKTSLLACLRRIGYPNAFPVHFPTSLKSKILDNYSDGSITYEINGERVEYAYRGQRWTPRPRTNADLFDKFGYSSVVYVGATAERITPRPEDFDPKYIKHVEPNIVKAVNSIFETEKFNDLRRVNLARGTGNEAFVLALNTSPRTYHSEKHFSLGELCVLKLLRALSDVSNNCLIIVDELEMALHPRAQVNLLRYLEEEAQSRSLTIIFSTHSVSLLKSVDRRRIIFLEKNSKGEVAPINNCFPTYAIGNIASREETLPDLMVYVEDMYARTILQRFFEIFAGERYLAGMARPTIKVVPIGGFKEVMKFLDSNKSVLPSYVKQFAVVDGDASDAIDVWRKNQNVFFLSLFNRNSTSIKYLPYTPEVGLLDFMLSARTDFELELKKRFSDQQLSIFNCISGYDQSLTGKPRRDNAKQQLDVLVSEFSTQMHKPEEMIRDDLCAVFAKLSWSQQAPTFKALFGPMVS